MSESSLVLQLAHRAKVFHQSTGISQSLMARAVDMTESNYSAFLNGKRGIGSESTCLLLKFTNMTRKQAIAQFTVPVRTSKVVAFQSQGRRMHFDNDGYVPGLSGTDPNDDGRDITDVPDAASQNGYDQATEDVLRQVRGLHRKAIRAIDDLLVQKARPNPQGSTPPNNQRFSS